MSLQIISDKIIRTKTLIFYFLKNPTIYNTAKSTLKSGFLSKRKTIMVENKRMKAKEIGKDR